MNEVQTVARDWLLSQPRTTIEVDTAGYLHAKSLSLLFGFPDSIAVRRGWVMFVGGLGDGSDPDKPWQHWESEGVPDLQREGDMSSEFCICVFT